MSCRCSGVIWEDTSPFMMARVFKNDGSAMLQADVTSIAYKVVDQGAPTVLVLGGALVKASVVFDTYQTDSKWSYDSTGYNFGFSLPEGAFPLGSKTYSVDINFVMVVGVDIAAGWEIETKKRFRPS